MRRRVLARTKGVGRFGERAGQRLLVDQLVGVPPGQGVGHLGRQQQQGRAVQPGVTQAGDRVGEARPQSRQADAGSAFQTTGRRGHVKRGTLVVQQHEVHADAAQGLQQFHVLAAGQAVDASYARLAQGPGDGLGHVHVNINLSRSSDCAAARSSGVPSGNQKSASTTETGCICA